MIGLMTVTRDITGRQMILSVGKEGMEIRFFPNGVFKPSFVWKVAEFPRSFAQAAQNVRSCYHEDGKEFSFTEFSKDVLLNGKFTPTKALPEDRNIALSISGRIGPHALEFSVEFDVFELGTLVWNLENYWEKETI